MMKAMKASSLQIPFPNRLKTPHSCWYAEAVCLGVTIGFSEVLLAIYYGSAELDPIALAIFMTVPAAFGALTQVAVTSVKRFFGSVRALASVAIAVQICGLLIMASALMANASDHIMMFVGQSLYWMGGMTSASPTQQILARGVDLGHHNRFFSRRAMVMTILTLVCNLASAQILRNGLTPSLMATFLMIAAAARSVSLILVFHFSVNRNTVHVARSARTHDESLVSILKLSLVVMLFRCAVNISSPFFSAYMLRDIHLDLTVYSMLTAIPLISKTLGLSNWARLLDDNRRFEGLVLAIIAIGCVPILWAIGSSTVWLGMLQLIAGMSWAGFDLISILLIQSMYPRSITQKLGLFLALSSAGSVAGSMIGGLILKLTNNYHLLFAVSGTLRLLAGFGLLWYLRRNHMFKFQNLRVKSGVVTLLKVKLPRWGYGKNLPSSAPADSHLDRVA
jgi:Major Facilitator Superfamily